MSCKRGLCLCVRIPVIRVFHKSQSLLAVTVYTDIKDQ